MRKDVLEHELANAKKIIAEQDDKMKQLMEDNEFLDDYKRLNLSLQLDIERLNKELEIIINQNHILADKCNTYETTFNVLKGVKENERY